MSGLTGRRGNDGARDLVMARERLERGELGEKERKSPFRYLVSDNRTSRA